MKENGKMINNKELEYLSLLMAPSMKASLSRVILMGKELIDINLLIMMILRSILAFGSPRNPMEMAKPFIIIMISMKESSIKEKDSVKEHIFLIKFINMLETGNIIAFGATENCLKIKKSSLKEIFKKG